MQNIIVYNYRNVVILTVHIATWTILENVSRKPRVIDQHRLILNQDEIRTEKKRW